MTTEQAGSRLAHVQSCRHSQRADTVMVQVAEHESDLGKLEM